jgi:lipopolysaccharide assembly outer membrane protein LptD (OstA)
VQDSQGEPTTPTVITCDGPLEIDYEDNIAHFADNVVAEDGRGTLVADYMDVYYNQTTQQVHKIIASGNVVIQSKEGNITYSDNAIYLADDGKVILGGDVEAFGKRNPDEGKTKKGSEKSLGFFGISR